MVTGYLGTSDAARTELPPSRGPLLTPIATLRRIAEIMQEQVDKVQKGHEAFRQHLANGGSRLDFDFKTYTPYGAKAVKGAKSATTQTQQPTTSTPTANVKWTENTVTEMMKYYNIGREDAIKRLEAIAAKRK